MDNYKIKLSKPYVFEGETHTEIDLQGLNDLKAKDLVEIDQIFIARGNNPALTGLTLEYAILLANRITSKPVEFYEGLPAREANQLKNTVMLFFYQEA